MLLSLLGSINFGVVSWSCDANRTFDILWIKLGRVFFASCYKLGLGSLLENIKTDGLEYKVFLTVTVIAELFDLIFRSYYLEMIADNFLTAQGY